MHGHYNIYYIFLEDKEKNPISPRGKAAVKKRIEKFYKKIKPNQNSQPLTLRKGQDPAKNGGNKK